MKMAFILQHCFLILCLISTHSTAEKANDLPIDETALSSYVGSGNTCKPGSMLKAYQKEGIPFIPFVTLTEAHSGSTWFRTMLNSHPCIRSHGETLRHREELADIQTTISSPTKTDNKKDVVVPLFSAGLKGFFTPTKGADNSEFNPSNKGVYEPVSKFLQTNKASRVIWLRRNPFDRFLSFLREAETGRPHCQAKVGCNIEKVHKLTFKVPITKMEQFLDVAYDSDKQAQEMLDSLGVPYFEVKYEDLISDNAQQLWGDILQFIGISREDLNLLSSDWRRQIIKTHKETVSNYDMVSKALTSYKGGRYLPLL